MPGSLGSRGLARMPKQTSQTFEAGNVCAMQEGTMAHRASGERKMNGDLCPPPCPQGSPILSQLHHLAPSQLLGEHTTRAQRGLETTPDHTATWGTSERGWEGKGRIPLPLLRCVQPMEVIQTTHLSPEPLTSSPGSLAQQLNNEMQRIIQPPGLMPRSARPASCVSWKSHVISLYFSFLVHREDRSNCLREL